REAVDSLSGSMQRQTRLSRSTRPGKRQNSNVVALEKRSNRRELLASAEEGRRLHRQVCRPVLQRPQRRKLQLPTLDQHLVEPLRLQQVLQPMRPQISNRKALI